MYARNENIELSKHCNPPARFAHLKLNKLVKIIEFSD